MISNNKQNSIGVLDRVYIGILLIIFGGIVLHAPLSVGLESIWPQYELLIKSWKEILMLIAGLMALFLMYKNKQFKILRNPIIIAIATYGLLHLIFLSYMYQGVAASFAGLAIDLRYLLFFSLVYIAMSIYPQYRKLFISVGIGGALIVFIFAFLQVFILSHDILKYIGYNLDTISPYLTIDKNNEFIRINSTLRGPNPLGAYAGIILTLVATAIAKRKIQKDRWSVAITATLIVGGLLTLWASYSRSALIGAVLSITIVVLATSWHKLSTKLWISMGILLIIIGSSLYLSRDSSFISNVVLHENPNGGSSISSNEGHASSLSDSFSQFIHQPLGSGIGSTGSASLLGKNTEIVENQYLFINHEIGWFGLALFTFIFVSVMVRLWKSHKDWLALGVFASGIGLAIIGLLLPVWTDDTVSIIWWGLAAVALWSPRKN